MIEWIKGAKIQGAETLSEGFKIENNSIVSVLNPGESSIFKDKNGRTIYDIVEVLKEAGLYLAETREE